jgi:hypothetical protein
MGTAPSRQRNPQQTSRKEKRPNITRTTSRDLARQLKNRGNFNRWRLLPERASPDTTGIYSSGPKAEEDF